MGIFMQRKRVQWLEFWWSFIAIGTILPLFFMANLSDKFKSATADRAFHGCSKSLKFSDVPDRHEFLIAAANASNGVYILGLRMDYKLICSYVARVVVILPGIYQAYRNIMHQATMLV